MSQLIQLPGGRVAEWSNRGEKLELWGPWEGGYRLLLGYLELVSRVPGWARGAFVTEWRAYSYSRSHQPQLLDTRDPDSFTSPEEIASWLDATVSGAAQ